MKTAHTPTLRPREFTAMTEDAKGSTRAVTICAASEEAARAALLRMGYARVLWVL